MSQALALQYNLRFILLFTACVLSTHALVAQGFEKEFAQLSRDAAQARVNNDLYRVEELRWDRLKVVKKAAADANDNTPIAAAYRVLEEVDGNDTTPGLINNLEFNPALDNLIAAWSKMVAAHPDGPVLGELATRIFEVIHQRDAFWSGADRNATGQAPQQPTDKQMLDILDEANKLDPCCVAAIPMAEWLRPLDPREAFLRAEVRPSLTRRQSQLLTISHPLLHAQSGLQAIQHDNTGLGEPGNKKGDRNEAERMVVLPWHASTEFLKAQSLERVIDEFNILEDVLPNWILRDRETGKFKYMVPRTPLKGSTADASRFELLYGRVLITTAKDKSGCRRSAVLLLDRKGDWEQRFIEVLWRIPTAQELRRDKKLQTLNDLLVRLEVLEEWEAGGSTIRLCTYPIHNTDSLISLNAKVLCVNDSLRLRRIRSTTTNTDPWRLGKELYFPDDDTFYTDEDIITAFREYNTAKLTDHPLATILKKYSPIVLLSKPTVKEKGPAFFQDPDDDTPCLRLHDGGYLYFQLSGEESPYCYKKTDVGTLVCPLTPSGIPMSVFLSSAAGQALTQVFHEVGLSQSDARRATSSYFRTGILPDKLVAFINKYARIPGQVDTPDQTAKPNQAAKTDLPEQPNQAKQQNNPQQRGARQSPTKLSKKQQTIFNELIARAREGLSGKDSGAAAKENLTFTQEINSGFQWFGYRHFKDNRGIYHFTSELSKSLPTGAAQKAENGKSSEEFLFSSAQPDGQFIGLEQMYSWKDLKDLKRNISDEYLAKTLLFEPSFGSYSAFIDDRLSSLIHPEDRIPPYLRATSRAVAPTTPTLKLVELDEPIPKWRVSSGKSNQLTTLTSLHNAYLDLLVDACGVAESNASSVPDDGDPTATQGYFIKPGTEGYPLIAIQWNSARRYAHQNTYHRAIVYYNDLLKRIRPPAIAAPYAELLESVPTTAKAEAFISSLEGQVKQTERLMILQTELAGVLRSAGLNDSAHAAFSRTIDDYELFVVPSIDLVHQMLTSYGIQRPPGIPKALASLESASNVSKRAIEQFKLASNWRSPDFAGGQAIAAPLARTERLAALLRKSRTRIEGQKLSTEESQDLEHLRAKDLTDNVHDFCFWLERKKLLLDDPDVGNRIRLEGDYDVRLSAPLKYDNQSGFLSTTDCITQYIQDTSADEVEQWCKLPLELANAKPNADVYSFLIAWYWLDEGDNSRVRSALVNCSRIDLNRAPAGAKKTTEGFVSLANSIAALACANCFTQSLPGIQGTRIDFTDGLNIQLAMWERRWLAAGLVPSHAAERADEVREIIQDAHVAMRKKNTEAGGRRYFFPDYRCKFGSVPDYVVRLVMDQPDLFQEVKQQEVKGERVPNAVAGERNWIKVSKEDAMRFYKSDANRVVETIDLKIIGLR